MTERDEGTSSGRWVRIVVPTLLGVSFICNVTALVVPFMEMSVFLKGTTTYTLPRSAALLWQAKLYAIAGLVVVFSIVFPFAKLAAQGWVWYFPKARHTLRMRTLRWLERLGKWSFLDIFVVCVILILSSDQFLVGAHPRVGLYVFVAAIGLSMLSAAIMAAVLHEPDDGPADRRALAARSGTRHWVVPSLLIVTLGSTVAALTVPYLQVDQFLLAGHSFSILRSVTALWGESLYGSACLVGITLVVTPLLSVVVMGVVWFAPHSPRMRHRWRRVLELAWQWSMLDVFGLALVVFLLEGKDLIRTEIRPGLPVFLGAAAVLTLTHVTLVYASRPSRLGGPESEPHYPVGLGG